MSAIHLKILFFIINIVTVWTEELDTESKGYFKFCEDSGINVEANKCPHGAWFSQPITKHSDCVCLNGIWTISDGWCDDDYYVAYGGGHCYSLNKKIQKLSFLGNAEDVLKPVNYISNSEAQPFRHFDKSVSWLPSTDTVSTILLYKPRKGGNLILDLQPNENLLEMFSHENSIGEPEPELVTESLCMNLDAGLDTTQKDSEDRLIILKFKSSQIQSVRIADHCPEHSKTQYEAFMEFKLALSLHPGAMVHIKSGKAIKSSSKCHYQCEQYLNANKNTKVLSRSKRDTEPEIMLDLEKNKNENLSQRSDSVKPTGNAGSDEEAFTALKPGDGGSTGNNPEMDAVGSNGPSLTDVVNAALGEDKDGIDFEPLKLDRESTEEEKDHAVNVANLRIVKQELLWQLEGLRPPTLKTPSWKLVKKLKEVFTTACPKEQAPKFLVNAMMRLFRLIYLNSKDYYPNGYIIEEKVQNERIEKALDNCLKDATPMEFSYITLKNPTKPDCRTAMEEVEGENGDWVEQNVTYCQCVDKLNLVNFSYAQNLSGEAEAIQLESDSTLTISSDLTFLMKDKDNDNTTGIYHDFPTETVWKLITFGHYYCSKYFRDNPGDHSALMTKLEDLFNEDIIYRWTRPGLFSNQIWQYLYSAFDLKKLAESMDACVSAAKQVSEYPEWLNRPTFELRRRKKRSLQTKISKNKIAYCLQDPWDPVKKYGAFATGNNCGNDSA